MVNNFIVIQEGGDPRIVSQPRGYHVRLRTENETGKEIESVNLYSVTVRPCKQGLYLFEQSHNSSQNLIEGVQSMDEGMEKAFILSLHQAKENIFKYGLPVKEINHLGEHKSIGSIKSIDYLLEDIELKNVSILLE